MKAYFGICGIGMGHAARCMSLIDRLLNMGWEISVSSYGDAINYLIANGIPTNLVPGVSYGVLPDGKVSIKLTMFENITLPIKLLLQSAAEISYISDFKPSVVVSDTRISTLLAAKLLGYPVVLILNQFNIKVEYPRHRRFLELVESASRIVTKAWEVADRILISDFPPPHTLSKSNLILSKTAEAKCSYVGPLFDLPNGPHPDKGFVCKKYGVPSDKPLVFMHLSGPKVEKITLAERLERISKKLNGYSIIMTLGEANSNQMRRYENMAVVSWVEDPNEIYSVADVVVSRAGHGCIARALAFGKPSVLIPIRSHGEQKSNSQSIAEIGAGIVLDEESLDESLLDEALERVLEDATYKRNAEKLRKLIYELDPINTAISIIERVAV